MLKRVIISGGGTGGHIYPAIAIANQLRAVNPTIEILFVGAEGKMEMEKVPKAGYTIVGLPIAGMQRSLSLANLSLPFKLLKSLFKAHQILKEFKPDVAVGVGGFASGPLLWIASWLGIPTLIQEQNSHAGITNKLVAKRAGRICVAYPNMETFFPKEKIRLLGNPVRKDILDTASKREEALAHFGFSPDRKTLFIMGGSLGAKSINESIAGGLEQFIAAGVQVLWQTGKPFYQTAQERIRALNATGVRAFDFIYEMDLAYAVADVVVSRAGALSVSELCLAGKPSILVPYPHAAEDHQTQNALSLVERQAALLVKDADAATELVNKALALLHDQAQQAQLIQQIKPFARPNAAEDIVAEIIQLVQSK